MNTHHKTLKLIRYTQTEEYMKRIGDYFAMYGYAQRKIMTPSLRSRRDYNYIKTQGCNIKGLGLPKKHMQTIKNIFDKGVTLWHVDRNGDKVGDYSKDNTEV